MGWRRYALIIMANFISRALDTAKEDLPVLGKVLGGTIMTGLNNMKSTITRPFRPGKKVMQPQKPAQGWGNIPRYLNEQKQQIDEINNLTK